MRRLQSLWLVFMTLVTLGVAQAQDVRITFPQDGQKVRGQINVQFEGLPAGGYATVKIDDNWVGATAENGYVFDTISDRTIFTRGDGRYKLEITVMNQGGKRVGSSVVNFEVANNTPETQGEAVKLVHWTPADRLAENVQRYRIFAESSSNVEQSAGAGGGGGAGDDGIEWIEAPLDWQVSALLRRVVRDVGMMDGAANIRTIVQDSFERQRKAPDENDPDNPAKKKKKKKAGSGGGGIRMKAPWDKVWTKASETGQYFVKMIQQNGTEINATRKAPTIAIGDLLPSFPDTPIRPGSTWETTMTVLGELSSRTPLNVRAPITFTAFETLQTPGSETRRCAKLESRFRLPEALSKKIAVGLENSAGRTAGQATGGDTAAGAGTVMRTGGTSSNDADALTEDDIDLARSDVSRVLWFDIERNQVLRSEDSIRTYYEYTSGDAGGGTGGAAPGAAAEPKKVSYNLNVTTWLDDRIPAPTNKFNGGVGTAHSRDDVTDPPISKVTGGS